MIYLYDPDPVLSTTSWRCVLHANECRYLRGCFQYLSRTYVKPLRNAHDTCSCRYQRSQHIGVPNEWLCSDAQSEEVDMPSYRGGGSLWHTGFYFRIQCFKLGEPIRGMDLHGEHGFKLAILCSSIPNSIPSVFGKMTSAIAISSLPWESGNPKS